MMSRTTRRRAGFTLIEMLMVMFALAVVMAAGAAVLLTAMKSARVGAVTLQRVAWRTDLADQFGADVAAADAAPDRLGDLAAGPDCLILRCPAAGKPGYVVYQVREGRLVRVERDADKDGASRPVPTGVASVVFSRPAGERPVLVLRLSETPPGGTVRRSEVAAALGGDLR